MIRHPLIRPPIPATVSADPLPPDYGIPGLIDLVSIIYSPPAAESVELNDPPIDNPPETGVQ